MPDKKPMLSIVLPTYEEIKNINILIPKIETLLKEKEYDGEIIVVDDSSPDGTAEAATKLNKIYKNIRVIVRKKKEGIGAALRHGYDEADGDIILSSDADLSFRPKDLFEIVHKIENGSDLVVGSRHLKDGGYEKGNLNTYIKSIVSKLGNTMIRLLSGIPLHDYSANFRGIRREVWNRLKTTEKTNTLLMEMIVKAKYMGYVVDEIPVEFKDRIYGESKLNLKLEAPKFFYKMIKFIIKYRIFKVGL